MRRWNVSQEKANAWFIAVVLCINTFSKILGTRVIIPYNIVMMETVATLSLALYNKGRLILSKTFSIILIVVACIMGYSLLLWTFDARVLERLLKFIMYAFFTMFCMQYPFEEKTLQQAIFTIGLLHAAYLFGYALFQLNTDLMSIDDTMDLSYTTLIYLFTASDIVVDKHRQQTLRLFALVMCLLFAYFLIVISTNRGALLAAGCFYTLRWVMRYRSRTVRVLLCLGITVLVVAAAQNYILILKAVDAWTTSNGFVIAPIHKTLWQQKVGLSTTSGREIPYAAAIQLIKSSLGMPNGVAGYHIRTQVMYYPHNIFLEAGVEFGIFGIVLAAVIILKASYCMIAVPQKYSRFFVILFCLSIPRLLVSSSYWENSYLWPMMLMMWTTDFKRAPSHTAMAI